MTSLTKSLYVGELDPSVSEAMLFEIFNMVGPVASLRVCRDAVTRRSLGYAYVNYLNAADGERALDLLNYSIIKNRPCRIMWSQRDPALRKTGLGNIFIKNLDESIDNKALHDTFAAFGNVLLCKVATDETGRSRGYGYVHYESAESAEAAIKAVDRMLLNDRQVFVGHHISRKERQSQIDELRSRFTNIYVRNLDTQTTEAEFRAMFEGFGTITSAVLQTDNEGKSRGFGFVNYEKHEEAERAVNEMNEKNIRGKPLFVGRAQRKAELQTELARSHETAKQELQNKYAGVNLYVKNLDDDIDDNKLRAEFGPFGTITSCKVMRNERGISKGFAFVCFSTPDEATKAVTEMNSKTIGSKPVFVMVAQRRDVRRQQLEGQIMQRNQMRIQQAPMMEPRYIPPQMHYRPGPSRHSPQVDRIMLYSQPALMSPRGRYPPGQPMPSTQAPTSHMGDVPPQDHSSQGDDRSTPLYTRPEAPFPNKINTPPPTSDIDTRLIGSSFDVDNLDEVDEDKIYSDREPSPVDESTNNQNIPPGDTSDDSIIFTYPKDVRYYQSDGSGVFLVDGVLFKVQATTIFGSRPKEPIEPNKGFTPVYLEDILPRLPESSIESPIELFGITKKQFRTYLLLITGLPYDEEYSSLFMDYLIPEKHSQDLFLRYLDIMVVAPRLGMTRLEEWATNAFHTIFTDSILSFYENPWHYDDLLRLIELTRKTTLGTSARVFAQYLIYRIARDVRHGQSVGENSSNITSLVEIYQGFKRSHNDNGLLGCVFLNVLSLGHRSRVWACLARDDKVILYAAQAQLADLPHEFAPGSFAWIAKPGSEQTRGLCTECQSRLSTIWSEIFGECIDRLGSNTPLKDVLILAEMPKYCRALWSKMDETDPGSCTALSSSRSPTTLDDHTVACSIRPLVRHVDQRVQNLYEQAASRYWAIMEEFQAN